MGTLQSDKNEYIVSLTSFPQRIKGIHNCIKSLLQQSYKPNKVILWLAETQFPNREGDLPNTLLRLRENGLEIKWCSDIRSYKKIIPALKEYQNANIITTDDDVYYPHNWLKGLVEASKVNPGTVCCYRAAKIIFMDESVFAREYIGKGKNIMIPVS